MWGVGIERSAFPFGVGWEIVRSGVWVRAWVRLVRGCETGLFFHTRNQKNKLVKTINVQLNAPDGLSSVNGSTSIFRNGLEFFV